jgi:hypothetical protein
MEEEYLTISNTTTSQYCNPGKLAFAIWHKQTPAGLADDTSQFT